MDENALYLSPRMYDLFLEKVKIETDAPLELNFHGTMVPVRKLPYSQGNQLIATGWLAEILLDAIIKTIKK